MTARSYLYVPGNRPDMLAKASERGADALIVDLEDAVPPGEKEEGRRTVAEWIHTLEPGGPEVWVRINSGGDAQAADLEAIEGGEGLSGVVLPKATRLAVAYLSVRLPPGLWVIPLVESAAGLAELAGVAASPLVVRLGLGEADLVAELGMRPSADERELLPIRVQVVVASAGAGLQPPIAPVSTDFRDLEGLERSTADLARMGFGARTAIHPAQVPVINRALTPEQDEVDRARRLVAAADEAAAAGSGVITDEEGRMVDEAVLRSARRLVDLAARYGTR